MTTLEKIQADYENSGDYFRHKYTFEEYREKFYFERDLIEEEARNIIEDGSVSDVVAYVLGRINDVFGGYNNGCSCCKTKDLSQALGFSDLDDEDKE